MSASSSNIELSKPAVRALTKLSQRSSTEINLPKALWDKVAVVMEQEIPFFLHVPTSQCDPTPKTRTAILQDTGALLAIPEDLAHLVLYQVEGRIHKLAGIDLSDEQWHKVQTLGTRLAMQHPDHVTNVVRLWKKVVGMKSEDVQETTVKNLELLWQHRSAEAVVVLDNLPVQMNAVKVEDMQVVVPKGEDKEYWSIE